MEVCFPEEIKVVSLKRHKKIFLCKLPRVISKTYYVMNLRDKISYDVRHLKPITLKRALQEALEAVV